MPSDVLKGIAEDFKTIDPKIVEAQELIQAMKDAGEPTAEMETELRALKIRKDKWARMLKARGLL